MRETTLALGIRMKRSKLSLFVINASLQEEVLEETVNSRPFTAIDLDDLRPNVGNGSSRLRPPMSGMGRKQTLGPTGLSLSEDPPGDGQKHGCAAQPRSPEQQLGRELTLRRV